MKCEFCHQKEATIHLTQVVNGVVKKIHICESCAEKKGWDVQSPISITDILFGLGQGESAGGEEASPPGGGEELELACPDCGMRRSDFKRIGRLGCPRCYDTFMGEIMSLINAMHHSNQHAGKIPARAGAAARRNAKLARLQKEIERAVAREEYEKAAELRDEVRALGSQEGSESE
ncbi:UvrB/UvrC motif-containing protein [Kiritimatiella glycovorans]|uniref:UVR domain-containing protein n=1 Tax=Kiritimatiella glycovorans TaxID=1307763 RepID=A0A0G3EIW1_9BACT|nr:UvrB/UvrC motif-containing protein [Kiritimatiella glycovorans]AKJ65342.1 hypothetical protein L21SP4_02110 [Kiritimatiella glycovorans]